MLSVTMKARKENVQLINIVCFYFLLLIQTGRCDNYINKFAVHVPKGYHAAQALVRDHGYIFHGQIGALENHFLLEHPHVHRRSATHSSEHHEKLSDHPEVHWFEQQQVVSRKKRDFQPVPAEFVHKQAAGVAPSRQRRDVARPNMQFNDELYGKMWYFNGGGKDHTDMNVQGAWRRGVTGKNVVITILDDGIERNHEDLVDNYDADASFDVNGNDGDPMPRYDYTNENRHGTRCAGEVSAKANNTKCVVGVAYNSKIGGIRMLDGDVYDAVEATSLSYNRSHIDIYSASWGPDDDGRVVDGPGPLAKKAFIDGIKMGRNGKGSIFVWASGNGGNQKDSCNCDGYTNSIYTLSISSISQTGLKPWYLEECSSTLASTYSSGAYGEKQIGRGGKGSIYVWASGNGGRMKDSCSCDGYTNSIYTMSISAISQNMQIPFYLEECASTLATTFSSGGGGEQKIITVDLHNRCTEMHTGTSASAPLAAGIVALILEINPHLTWRDVQYITLMTSRPLPNGEWVTNGVGRQVSLRYGYGLMDATAMVDLAEKWTKIPAQHICEVQSDKISVEIPDSGYAEILDTNACAGTNKAINYLEHTQAKMTIKTKRRGDLVIHLTSPMGTRSTILPARPNDRDRAKGFNEWEFLSVHFWGENPVGQWKLEIDVQKNTGRSPYFGSSSGVPASNILVKWSLVMYGTEENPVNLVPPTAHPPTGEPVTVPGEDVIITLETTSSPSTTATSETTASTKAGESTITIATTHLPSTLASTTSKQVPSSTTTVQSVVTVVTTSTTSKPAPTSVTTVQSVPSVTTSSTTFKESQETTIISTSTTVKEPVVTVATASTTPSELTTLSQSIELKTLASSSELTTLVPTPELTTLAPSTESVTTDFSKTVSVTMKSCHAQCLGGCTGNGADQCNACQNYKMQDSGVCVPSCPNNYYLDGLLCRVCNSSCETCTHISNQEVMCLKCKPGYLLVEGKGTCVPKCDKGYYKDDQMHHCRMCSGMCAECAASATNCTACRSGLDLLQNSCVPETLTCVSGQYRTPSGCAQCPIGCFSCTNGKTCTCCNKGSYLQNGQCVPSCATGYQAFHVNYSSKFVFQQCQHCEQSCNACPEGFNFIKGVCVQQSNCPDGTYFQWNSMSCKMCNTSCRSCIGPSYSDCLSCYPSYGYNNLLRRCMKCCNKKLTNGAKDCCNCIEEGKCDLHIGEGDTGQESSVPTIFIIVLTVIVTALVVFIVVLGCHKYMRSRTWQDDVTYNKLINNDLDVEEFQDA